MSISVLTLSPFNLIQVVTVGKKSGVAVALSFAEQHTFAKWPFSPRLLHVAFHTRQFQLTLHFIPRKEKFMSFKDINHGFFFFINLSLLVHIFTLSLEEAAAAALKVTCNRE